jgi:hypothetical protein
LVFRRQKDVQWILNGNLPVIGFLDVHGLRSKKVPGIGGAALAVVAYVIPLLRGNNLPTVAGLLMSEHTHLTLRAR